MKWRDFFYFNKGERQALPLLLGVIVLAWGILLFTDIPQTPSEKKKDFLPDTIATTHKPTDQPAKLYSYGKTDANHTRRGKAEKAIATQTNLTSTAKTSTHRPYVKAEKYPVGTVVELNTADTTILKKVPGIGSFFAQRIVKFRDLLGGFYSVTQLSEVYGIDKERYEALKPWFVVDSTQIRKLTINQYPIDSFPRHPYVSFRQVRAIQQLRRQHKTLDSWNSLRLLEEFTEADRQRLAPYLSYR